jgi:hypothetical protein
VTAISARGLRLALFSDTYAPQINGVARTLERLAREVRARGGDVVIVPLTPGQSTTSIIEKLRGRTS